MIKDKISLVRRGYSYDVYLDGKLLGSGQWGYVSTAYHFYYSQGFDVQLIE